MAIPQARKAEMQDGPAQSAPVSPVVLRYFSALGKKGGRARQDAMTDAERTALGRRGAGARLGRLDPENGK